MTQTKYKDTQRMYIYKDELIYIRKREQCIETRKRF